MLTTILIRIGMALSLAWVAYSIIWVFHPIRRDRIIAEKQGRFLIGVIAFVIAVPLMISTLIIALNSFGATDIQAKDIFFEENQSEHNLLWTVYFHYMDPGNQNHATDKGNVWVMVVSMLGLFLINGLLVTTILNWIDQRKEQRRTGKIRYDSRAFRRKKYAIVIGANEIASSIIKHLFSNSKVDYIILQTSSDVSQVRDTLASHLPESYLDRIIFYNALRDSQEELKLLHIENAADLYILGENTTWNGGETQHDAISMRCVTIVANLLMKEKLAQEKKGKTYTAKECKVLFDYQATNSIFQFADVSIAARNTMRIIPINRYESWARMLMVENHAKEVLVTDEENFLGTEITETAYTPLDGDGIGPNSEEHVHLVIVGMSKMGVALAQQALFQAHYPNFREADTQPKRTRITFIDKHANTEMSFFKGRYTRLFELMRHRYIDTTQGDTYAQKWTDPIQEDTKWLHLCDKGANFIDVEMEFINGSIESDNIRAILREISEDKTAKLTIAICLTQTYQAVAAALYLPLEMYENENLQEVWVYQREVSDIIKSMTNMQLVPIGGGKWQDVPYQRYRKLKPFGMLYADILENPNRVARAKLVNLAYDMSDISEVAQHRNELLQRANKDWENLPIHLRLSNQCFVDLIAQKLRTIHIANIDKCQDTSEHQTTLRDAQMSICEHNRWNMEKLLVGFSPSDAKTCQQLIEYLNTGNKDAYKALKNKLKAATSKVHPDICAFNILTILDPGAVDYDEKLNAAIPKIIELTQGDNQ